MFKTILLCLSLVSLPALAAKKSCMSTKDCPAGYTCVTAKGEYPGGCAQGMKDVSVKKTGCYKNSDCKDGKVCATVKGEYPGSCADGLR